MKGKIHSLESFGAADGPGVRYIVFLHACPFRCVYCHNPDTWAGHTFMEMSADEVLERAIRYKDYWGAEGGITLSGGEPMLQAQFAVELFERAHSAGISTCLDTAAGVFDRSDENIIKLIDSSDIILLDIKAFDLHLHQKITGMDNLRVLDCARYLSEQSKRVWIRRVLVPGLTDSQEDLMKTAEFVRQLSNVEKVEILPYHSLGESKWHALGMQYSLTGVRHPSAQELEQARSYFVK